MAKFVIRRRIEGTQIGGHRTGRGNVILKGLEVIEVRETVPDEGWEEYLYKTYGRGEFSVITNRCGSYERIFYSDCVGQCSSEECDAPW